MGKNQGGSGQIQGPNSSPERIRIDSRSIHIFSGYTVDTTKNLTSICRNFRGSEKSLGGFIVKWQESKSRFESKGQENHALFCHEKEEVKKEKRRCYYIHTRELDGVRDGGVIRTGVSF